MAAVLDAGDDWIFVYTTVRFDQLDANDFKFLDRLSTIENNGIFDTLVVQYGLEQIVFVDQVLREKFESSSAYLNLRISLRTLQCDRKSAERFDAIA